MLRRTPEKGIACSLEDLKPLTRDNTDLEIQHARLRVSPDRRVSLAARSPQRSEWSAGAQPLPCRLPTPTWSGDSLKLPAA